VRRLDIERLLEQRLLERGNVGHADQTNQGKTNHGELLLLRLDASTPLDLTLHLGANWCGTPS
jgi:hypothetical protein